MAKRDKVVGLDVHTNGEYSCLLAAKYDLPDPNPERFDLSSVGGNANSAVISILRL